MKAVIGVLAVGYAAAEEEVNERNAEDIAKCQELYTEAHVLCDMIQVKEEKETCKVDLERGFE